MARGNGFGKKFCYCNLGSVLLEREDLKSNLLDVESNYPYPALSLTFGGY